RASTAPHKQWRPTMTFRANDPATRAAALTRGAQLKADRAHQQHAQSCRTPESLTAAGVKGWQATKAKLIAAGTNPMEWLATHQHTKREAHLSALETLVVEMLARYGYSRNREYLTNQILWLVPGKWF